jgi:hypothetical protein
MMKHPLYMIYGLLVLGWVGYAEYRGWSLDRVNQVKNVPKSVRDNPGAYRSIYAGYPRYIGGK